MTARVHSFDSVRIEFEFGILLEIPWECSLDAVLSSAGHDVMDILIF